MNLKRAINTMGWKMLGHSPTHVTHEDSENAAIQIRTTLFAYAEFLDAWERVQQGVGGELAVTVAHAKVKRLLADNSRETDG